MTGFNAVIEGTQRHEEGDLRFKIANVEVSKDTAIIRDGINRYKLYGTTDDSGNVQETDAGVGGLETTVGFLGSCQGVILPFEPGVPPIFEITRAVCMRDGRVYVNEKMTRDEEYMELIPSIVEQARELFNDGRFPKFYDRVTRS